MFVKQFLEFSIVINSFEEECQITVEPNVKTEVDDLTGQYLIGMKSFDLNGNLATDIREVS